MRQFLLLILLLQLTSLPLHAQWLKALRTSKQTATHTIPNKWEVSYQLHQRLKESYYNALQAMSQIPEGQKMPIGEPTRRSFHNQRLNPADIYPDVPFLTTAQQTADYLLSRNNRLFLQEVHRMEEVWNDINTHLPTLMKEANQVAQPENPTLWLAAQIPLEANQIFLGEVHGYPEIKQTVRELIGIIRQIQPRRQIILFTEFLPEKFTWEGPSSQGHIPTYLHKYIPIWNTAIQNRISVVGLEPRPVIQSHCTCSYTAPNGQTHNQLPIWATLEGVRVRNEHWMSILSQYREQYPDALFIMYTGAYHALYNCPFSLAANYPKETTFIAALYPDKKYKYTSPGKGQAATLIESPYSGPLEYLTQQADFPQPALKWSSHQLSKVAGFDARIKISVKLD